MGMILFGNLCFIFAMFSSHFGLFLQVGEGSSVDEDEMDARDSHRTVMWVNEPVDCDSVSSGEDDREGLCRLKKLYPYVYEQVYHLIIMFTNRYITCIFSDE